MQRFDTSIPGLFVLSPKVFRDDRGYFMESFNDKVFKDLGIDYDFVQDNHSRSVRGVLRGLHYQKPPFDQAKLVRCVRGAVYDVVVDIRKGSSTFGKWHGEILSDWSHKMLMVPEGFAHGFLVLSDEADVLYKTNKFYSKESEAGLRWNDPDIGIPWHDIEKIINERDQSWPLLKELAETP